MIDIKCPPECTGTDTSHLGCTVGRGARNSLHVVCDGCGNVFPAKRNLDGDADSPQWERHARDMQHRGCPTNK